MIHASFKNPFVVLVMAIFVVVLSAVLIPRMAVDILPQFKKSAMQIITLYPGMPAEVVEKDITSRMERWTGQSPGIEKQLSKSLMGVSIVTNYYGEDVSPAEAMANTSAYAMSDMYYQPPGTLPPMVQPFDPTASKPLMLLTVSSATKSGKELYDLAYYNLRQMLSGVPGIVAPAAYGGSKRRIHIYVDPSKLEAMGLSQTQVNDAIKRNTTMIPSGIAQFGDINFAIDAKGMIIKVEDFNEIVIAYKEGKAVTIKDIGYASDASMIQTNIARVDGREQVYLPIFKRPGANTIESVEGVKRALPEMKRRMPDDVNLQVIFDQSSYVRNAISGLTYTGLGGLVLVIIVLLVFLGNVRSALIVAISLPLSVLFAFLTLSMTGQAINSITLGGITLVLGLLVDNSIVVIENIDRHLQMGKSSTQAAKDAALEVATPVLASTLVIMVVFFPVIFLTGMAKFLFSPLALTVAGAMLGSYLFSLTLVPLMAAKLFKGRLPRTDGSEQSIKLTWFQSKVMGLRRRYLASLQRVLAKPTRLIALMLIAFIASMGLATQGLGYELFPQTDVGQMEIQVRLESGTPLRQTEVTVAAMEGKIREVMGDDLDQIIANIGVVYDLPAAYTPNSGTQDAFIAVQLTADHGVSTFDYAIQLRELFATSFPGVECSFNTGGLITAALNDGKPSPIDVQILGNDLHELRRIAEAVKRAIIPLPGATDVRILQRVDQPTKDIDIDRRRAAELGVEPVDAIKNMVSALNSSATFDKAFWIDERNGNHYYVGVTYPEELINDVHLLDNVMVSSHYGKSVPFRSFSEVTESTNPVEINHHKLQRVFNVYCGVQGRDIGSLSDDIQAAIQNIPLPKGYDISFQGETATMKRSFADLGVGLVLSMILAFLIIVPLFRSFRQPLIILLSFPMGLIGVVGLMWLTNTAVNIQSIMGVIMMIGIAVSYGNILIDRINALVKEGLSQSQAIIQGAEDRFRPILMTATTTVCALIPTAIATSAGSEPNVPLAIAVIGGTIMSTLITLYLIPVGFALLNKPKQPAS